MGFLQRQREKDPAGDTIPAIETLQDELERLADAVEPKALSDAVQRIYLNENAARGLESDPKASLVLKRYRINPRTPDRTPRDISAVLADVQQAKQDELIVSGKGVRLATAHGAFRISASGAVYSVGENGEWRRVKGPDAVAIKKQAGVQ